MHFSARIFFQAAAVKGLKELPFPSTIQIFDWNGLQEDVNCHPKLTGLSRSRICEFEKQANYNMLLPPVPSTCDTAACI